MTSISVSAYGKINLSLDVLGLRPDGYHQLASVMQSIQLSDRLTFNTNNTGIITLACSEPTLTTGEENLVVRAARLLQERYCPDKGVDIFLEKKLPIGAGLGGGSSDAAATMRTLSYLWDLGLTLSTLISLGCKLGADVAFCLAGGTALAQGIGEKLTILPPAPKLWLVLVKPAPSLRAGDVYRYWDLKEWTTNNYTSDVLDALVSGDKGRLVLGLGNDLERAVKHLVPEVEEIIEELRRQGAIKAMVSGSGPTVFGVLEEEAKAIALSKSFRDRYGEVYLTTTI